MVSKSADLLLEAGLSDIPQEWDVVTIGQILSKDKGIAVGVMYPGDHDPSGIPLIRAGDLNGNRINSNPDFRISSEKHFEYRRTALEGGELLLSLVGNLGQSAVVPDSMIGWNAARAIAVVRLADKSDTAFVRLCLMSRPLQYLMNAWATTTVQATLNLKEIKELPIPWPPKKERDAWVATIGALDDKIELNRHMNRTLESMVRVVFRQWFVDNDGVESWKVGKLGDVITNFDSKRVPVANRERAQRQGKYPYYGAASIMDYVDNYLFDGIYVLMGEDGSVVDDEGHPVIQYVWGKIWVNNHAHVLQGTNGICNEHLYIFLKEVNILPYITGAVQLKINQANMNSIPFPLPPMELRKRFEEFVSPLFAKIRANDEESRTLASLRDSLLPKLMQGEVRMKV